MHALQTMLAALVVSATQAEHEFMGDPLMLDIHFIHTPFPVNVHPISE